jgi:GT2 family glycosyltransferase
MSLPASSSVSSSALASDPFAISIILVNYNGCADLRECLRSLAEQRDRDFQIVLVDNGSADDSCAMVRRDFPEVKLVEAGENLGFAEGCNRGLRESTAPWVFMLNNDTRLHPDAVAELRAAARRGGPELGMLQARIVFMDRPEVTNSTGVLVYSDGVFIDRDFAAPLRPQDTAAEIFCVSAGAALYRRAMLDAVRLPTGVFDRSFFMYFEDVDLGWRCRLCGFSAQYVPQALVYHRFHGSSGAQKRGFVAAHCHANKLRTLLKNASLGYIVKALPAVILFDVLPLFRHRPQSAAGLLSAAVRDGLSQRPIIAGLVADLGAGAAGPRRRDVEARWIVPRRQRRTRADATPL